MASEFDEPRIEFGGRAEQFLDSQSQLVQVEVILLAGRIYRNPRIDGETKTLERFVVEGDVVQRMVYMDRNYTIIYDFDSEADPPVLVVWDIELTPSLGDLQ